MALLMPALTLGLGACSSGTVKGSRGPAASTAGGQTANFITIENFAFAPGTLTVHPGATVTVDNKDSVTHTVTSLSGTFDVRDISSGSEAHFTAPTKPGTYPFHCNIHQFMTGTLVVSSN